MTAETKSPWKLIGFDTFEGEWYELDGEYASEAEAETAAKARLVKLEKDQPTASSGGQYGGIQDRVFIESPDGKRRRIYG